LEGERVENYRHALIILCKRSVSTVFLRQGAPVMLEEWELSEAQKS
jgi:hypothetical protein